MHVNITAVKADKSKRKKRQFCYEALSLQTWF